MKKYTALSLSILSLFGLIWVLVVMTKMKLSPHPKEAVTTEETAFLKEGQNQDNYLKSLSRVLTSLENLDGNAGWKMPHTGPLMQVGADIPEKKSMGVSSGSVGASFGKVDSLVALKKKEPEISVIFLSTDMKMVVINGRTLGEGDRLENGGRIAEIDMDSIVYELAGKRHVIKAPRQQVLGSAMKSAE